MENKVNLMLDSGAFSAWRQQDPINLDEYAAFLDENYQYIDTTIGLDIIPGVWGKTRTREEVDYAAAQGFKNFLFLRKRGFEVVPVFHQGEQFKWLDKILDSGCSYIGVAPINNAGSDVRRVWMDRVFAYLCGDKGYPEVKTHGFGMTVPSLIQRYPWYSVDSVSWLMVGAYGSLLVPKKVKGAYDYNETPYVVSISTRGSKFASVNSLGSRDYEALGALERIYVDEYCHNIGFSVEELQRCTYARKEANYVYYKRLALGFKAKKFLAGRSDLFNRGMRSNGHGVSDPKWVDLKFIFGCGLTRQYSAILQRRKEKERLLSYYDLRTKPSGILPRYVRVGQFPGQRIKLKAKPAPSNKRVKLSTKVTRIKLKGKK